jgi:hypothetical protein
MKTLSPALLLLPFVAVPAFAGVTVASPVNGESVNSTFTLSANAATCSSQNVTVMGYSLDSGTDIQFTSSTALQTNVSAGTGGHTVHVKAWGNKGAVCVTDVAVTITAGASVVPSNAISVSNIQNMGNWVAKHDAGSGGSSTGGSVITGTPSRSGNARQFSTTFSNYGGEIFNAAFGDDTTAQNFFYDGWVYIAQGSSVANLEMDMNQTMPNGLTVIYGFQCDGWSHTWDYTLNKGTPTSPVDAWAHSNAYCNPAAWSTNAWHHVQVSYSRDGSGNVCYKSVWLDGAEQDLYITVPSAFALGWAPTLLTNFQIDGGSPQGGSVVYLDNLIVYRW